MDRGLKERLVGAAVLVALAVIFIPMLLDETPSGPGPITESNIPEQPDEAFNSRIVPVKPEPAEVELPPAPTAESSTDAAAESRTAETGDDDASTADNSAAAGVKSAETTAAPADDADTASKPTVSQSMPEAGAGDTKPSGWVVQLGSFAKEDNARDLNKKLQADGYAAFVEPVMSAGERVYRVRVGPQVLRDDAEKVRDRIAGEFDIKGIVISYP